MTEQQQRGSEPPPAEVTSGEAPPPEPEPRKRGGLRRVGYAAAGGAGVLGFLAWKFVLPVVLVGVAGQVFGSAFGGPYNRLPGDVRAGFEQRFEAAVGDTFDDQSDAEQEAQIVALVEGGLPRLDDAHVETNFRLSVQGIQAVSAADCAAIAKAFFAGTEPPDDAYTALIGSFSDADLQRWFEIRVLAIEAETRGTPPAVLISDAEVEPLYEKVFVAMNQADVDTFADMSNGATPDDARLCSAIRGIYGASLTLAPEEVRLFARYDVTP